MHRPANVDHSADLLALLNAFTWRSRRQALVIRTIEAVVILVGGMFLIAIAHRFAALPSLLREIIFDGLIAVGLSRVLPAVGRIMRPINPVLAAERIERRFPQLEQRLSTWTSCVGRGEAGAWVTQLRDAVLGTLPEADRCLHTCLPWNSVLLRSAGAGGLIALGWIITRTVGADVSGALPPWR